MPSSTRRARERASTRDRIIQAALHVLETEGAAALTIRRIAADVEYTPPIVYQYFANKDALVLELVAHGYRLMTEEVGRAAAEEPDIDRRMLRVASEYVRFADEHPHLYQAMNDTTVDADGRRLAALPTINLLLGLLATWSDAHGVVLADSADACEIVWGTLYGIASLGRHDAIGTERAQRLARQALSALLRGWHAGGSDSA
ncbi:TetR/AcrR family transcriptional regulator [Amycolatopsis rhizosphaerae]|uniref:TetR/AcrR family transcriptional regulator n=1 Tax=Amycolatopsis rhizosphaerae TaxID=2053003 RepID=A0A558DNS0_9PSEU|nr:TetR/AcrR family transcriptional regulator [Amycolatopsis rhizosphaerae]TVT62628.1 TetR/AcrR family transcriptional regulator [Amycolatopsis rhizosphaerae]